MSHIGAAARDHRDGLHRRGGCMRRVGGELDDRRRLAIRCGLSGLGVLAMIAFLPRLFRRFHAKEPLWIECDELQRRLTSGDPVMLLDVRQPDEFTSPPGHLPGAVNVPLAELTDRTPDLARRQQPIVVVCKTDRRSARAATELLTAGLRDVAVLRGGTDAWHQRGLALK
jgi:rhodanese-related sulfurtransferase